MMVTESQEEGKSMKKSVYSLVLSDDVVEAVDRAAYQNGLSRSAMVNQILADYVSYTTPEKRMREIFSQVDTLKSYHLDVPQVTLLAHELKKAGMDLPEGILTREELLEALCR